MAEKKEENKTRVQTFNRATNTWQFTFKDPTGEEVTFEFHLATDMYKASIASICKKSRSCSVVVEGGIVREDGSKAEMIFVSRIPIPNLWPNRDPNTVFSHDEATELLISIIRDVNAEIIRRSIGDWILKESDRSGAISFQLNFIDK